MKHYNSFSQVIKSRKRLARKHHFSVIVGQYLKLLRRRGTIRHPREYREEGRRRKSKYEPRRLVGEKG